MTWEQAVKRMEEERDMVTRRSWGEINPERPAYVSAFSPRIRKTADGFISRKNNENSGPIITAWEPSAEDMAADDWVSVQM